MFFFETCAHEEYITIDACTYPFLAPASNVEDILIKKTIMSNKTTSERQGFRDRLQDWLETSGNLLCFSFDFSVYRFLQKLLRQCSIMKKTVIQKKDSLEFPESRQNITKPMILKDSSELESPPEEISYWKDISLEDTLEHYPERSEPTEIYDCFETCNSTQQMEKTLFSLQNESVSTSSMTEKEPRQSQQEKLFSSIRLYLRWMAKPKNDQKVHKKPHKNVQRFLCLTFRTKKLDDHPSHSVTFLSNTLQNKDQHQTTHINEKEIDIKVFEKEASDHLLLKCEPQLSSDTFFLLEDKMILNYKEESILMPILKAIQYKNPPAHLETLPVKVFHMIYALFMLKYTTDLVGKISWSYQVFQLIQQHNKSQSLKENCLLQPLSHQEVIHLCILNIKYAIDSDNFGSEEKRSILLHDKATLGFTSLLILRELCFIPYSPSQYQISSALLHIVGFLKWLQKIVDMEKVTLVVPIKRACLYIVCHIILMLHSIKTLKLEESWSTSLWHILTQDISQWMREEHQEINTSLEFSLQTLRVLLPYLVHIDYSVDLEMSMLVSLISKNQQNKQILQPILEILNILYKTKPKEDVLQMLTTWTQLSFWSLIIECCCLFPSEFTMAYSVLHLLKNAYSTSPDVLVSCLNEKDFHKLNLNFIEATDDILDLVRPILQDINHLFITSLSNHSTMTLHVIRPQDTLTFPIDDS